MIHTQFTGPPACRITPASPPSVWTCCRGHDEPGGVDSVLLRAGLVLKAEIDRREFVVLRRAGQQAQEDAMAPSSAPAVTWAYDSPAGMSRLTMRVIPWLNSVASDGLGKVSPMR